MFFFFGAYVDILACSTSSRLWSLEDPGRKEPLLLRQAALEACPSWLQCLNWKVLFWKRCTHLSGSLQALPSFAAAKTAGGIENHILGWPSRNATAKVGVCVCRHRHFPTDAAVRCCNYSHCTNRQKPRWDSIDLDLGGKLRDHLYYRGLVTQPVRPLEGPHSRTIWFRCLSSR